MLLVHVKDVRSFNNDSSLLAPITTGVVGPAAVNFKNLILVLVKIL